ncbi:hypothetical protein BCY86_04175 [Pajaroellobacter abortibovis]|uniref:Uncharacterized protein n=1 Tax=Pajaroellobacter abortibovis TaxID=1882918 RepID=A0A1L6MWQ4_9BACT|nr:hypothetical protein BCY86_04175 [Pajaroellobacter abortibovis]
MKLFTDALQLKSSKLNELLASQNKNHFIEKEARYFANQADQLVIVYKEGKGTSLELIPAGSALRHAEILLTLS